MGIAANLYDSLVNFVTGLGTGKDPTRAAHWEMHLLNRAEQEKMYRTNWIARAVIDAPAEDASREWRAWQADREQIAAIESLEKKFRLQEKFKQAVLRGRLYGGAAIVLGIDQGKSQDELILDKVGKDDLKFVVVLNRYELNAGPRIYDVMSPWYTRPAYYTVATPVANVNMTGKTELINNPPGMPDQMLMTASPPEMAYIHPSRVIEFVGNALPDWRLAPLGGTWGDSVLQTCEDELRDMGLTMGSMANMVSDAKMDVIHVPDLSRNITTKEYETKLLQRFMLANAAKSTVNTLILDEKETWERIQTNFGGLPQILQQMLTIACGAGGIPVSRAMGSAPSTALSSKGGSGGEVDVRNYYDRIAARQETEYRPAMTPLDRCLIQSALGHIDESITYRWNSLYKPDPLEKAQTDLVKAQVFTTYQNTGLFNDNALRQAGINQIIEDEVMPGFEDAVEEFGAEPDLPVVKGWTPSVDPETGKPLPGAAKGDDKPRLPPPGDDEFQGKGGQ